MMRRSRSARSGAVLKRNSPKPHRPNTNAVTVNETSPGWSPRLRNTFSRLIVAYCKCEPGTSKLGFICHLVQRVSAGGMWRTYQT